MTEISIKLRFRLRTLRCRGARQMAKWQMGPNEAQKRICQPTNGNRLQAIKPTTGLRIVHTYSTHETNANGTNNKVALGWLDTWIPCERKEEGTCQKSIDYFGFLHTTNSTGISRDKTIKINKKNYSHVKHPDTHIQQGIIISRVHEVSHCRTKWLLFALIRNLFETLSLAPSFPKLAC